VTQTCGEAVRRVLFLSGSLGKGHDVVADACIAALDPYGVESRVVDSMALLGKGFSAVGDRVFRRLLSVTPVYDVFHLSQLRDGHRVGQAMERIGVDKMYGAVRDEVERFDPQLLVAVFPTGAGAAARLKRERGGPPCVVIMTDSMAHRMWVHDETELFLVTSRLAAESVRRYRPEAPTRIVTAPVRPEFRTVPDREEARRKLGVPAELPCVLVMSGAWGIGPIDDAAERLASDGYSVLAVAGSNEELQGRLDAVAARHPEVVSFGYTDRVPELMAACDVVVTSSGDTCREARLIRRPIILLDVVPGHGRENLLHELDLGGAAVCDPTPDSIARTVRAFLADPERSTPLPAPDADEAARQFIDSLRSLGLVFAAE
jgi:processive 1,2-diacylglycerol beta-glucosyltransferase